MFPLSLPPPSLDPGSPDAAAEDGERRAEAAGYSGPGGSSDTASTGAADGGGVKGMYHLPFLPDGTLLLVLPGKQPHRLSPLFDVLPLVESIQRLTELTLIATLPGARHC